MDLQTELNKLKVFIGNDTESFIAQHKLLIAEFKSDKEQKIIQDFVENGMKEQIEKLENGVEEAKVKLQLATVAEIVSLSYISKRYFNKTRNWLYQKINGNTVNGKKAKFTSNEVDTLNFAIQDISRKLGSTVVSL